MANRRTIIFVFAGRRPNMQLQLPLIQRILDCRPEVEYHVWNLTKSVGDDVFVRSISGDRIAVFNHFHGSNPWLRFNDVWRHYADEQYADALLVKIDDDVVFIETERFDDFIAMIDANRDSVVSANTINNGACTQTEPDLWQRFIDLGIPLLDVHQSAEYAAMCHNYALDNWSSLIGQPVKLIPTRDWLSINLIGFDGRMAQLIARDLGGPSPQHIAGRFFRKNSRLGDEGAVNTLPRRIMQGFLATHLSFGPQDLPETEWDAFRSQYALLGSRYLEHSAHVHVALNEVPS